MSFWQMAYSQWDFDSTRGPLALVLPYYMSTLPRKTAFSICYLDVEFTLANVKMLLRDNVWT